MNKAVSGDLDNTDAKTASDRSSTPPQQRSPPRSAAASHQCRRPCHVTGSDSRWRWLWCWWWWWWCSSRRSGWSWSWPWRRMRLLPLLIMTGLGFTLGLLCGLLLQLPADGLPAADTHSSYRTRRSFSADGGQGETGQVPSHQPSVPSDAEWRGSFQWDSDGVGKGPDPSGPRAGVNNLRGPQGLSDTGLKRPEVNRAEPSVGRTGEVEARDGENRQAPPPSRPVTSLTLRIKNTGEKFVVDSAVRRQAEEDLSIAKNRESNTDTHSSKQAGGHASPDNGTSTLSGVVSGTVWSKVLDESCPAGFEPREVSSWRRKASGMAVVKMEEGCGRMQNRLLTFRDGSRACAR